MSLYKSDKIRFISGLIFIIIIYTWTYIFFLENKDHASKPKIIIYLLLFSATLAVYFVGTFHLGKLKDKWMSSLWHIIHISGLGIITSIGLFDWLISEVSVLRQFALSIQELLISPVLYVAMGLLNKSLKKDLVE